MDGGVDDVGELQDEAVEYQQRAGRGVEIREVAADAHDERALHDGRIIIFPVGPLDEQRHGAHAEEEPADRRERRAEHGLRGDEAVRAGGRVEHAETQQGNEAAA